MEHDTITPTWCPRCGQADITDTTCPRCQLNNVRRIRRTLHEMR